MEVAASPCREVHEAGLPSGSRRFLGLRALLTLSRLRPGSSASCRLPSWKMLGFVAAKGRKGCHRHASVSFSEAPRYARMLLAAITASAELKAAPRPDTAKLWTRTPCHCSL